MDKLDYDLNRHPFAGPMLPPIPPGSPQEVCHDRTNFRAPVAYRGASMFILSLAVESAALKSVLPKGLEPRRLFGPYGCLNLQFVSMPETDVGPYNECVVSVACEDKFNWPEGVPTADWRPLPCFPLWLSVNTSPARDAGHLFWAYPKVLAETTFDDDGDHLIGTVIHDDRIDLEVTVPKMCNAEPTSLQIRSLTVAGGDLWQTAFSGNASAVREQDVDYTVGLGGHSAITNWLGSITLPERALEMVSVTDFTYELPAPFNVIEVSP